MNGLSSGVGDCLVNGSELMCEMENLVRMLTY